MRAIRADEVNKATGQWWVWHDCGDGEFALVLGYNRRDGWLRCQGRSFMVCADAECVQFDTREEMNEERERRRGQLALSRA